MIFSERNPWSTARLTLLDLVARLERQTFNDDLLIGSTRQSGPWSGLEISEDCRIVVNDPGGSGQIFPGNIVMLNQGAVDGVQPGWHPYQDGIFGLQRAMAYAGQREWITVNAFQGAHTSLEELLCFGLLIEKGDHYANAEHADRIDEIRKLFAKSSRGRRSGAEDIARKVRTTKDVKDRYNPPRFGLTHPALQRRAAAIAERAHMNAMWANRLGLFATQLISDCEIMVNEVLLALRQALRAPWMDGRVLPQRLKNAQREHWPLLVGRLQLITVHPLAKKAQRAAGRIRDAASATTSEERIAHLESARNIVLGLKLRLIIGDLQRVTGLMERQLIPGDAREYLRIASTVSALRDPTQNFGMSSFGLGPSLMALARAAGEQDAEKLNETLRSIAHNLDAA